MSREPYEATLKQPAQDAIRAFGARFDAEVLAGTRSLFEAAWDFSAPQGANNLTDVAFGPHPRQRLDICSAGREKAPILLYVPGGGFTGGDKAGYRHVGAAFARLGFSTAVVNYRLAPDHAWPAGALDVAAALDWLAGNAAALGGDAGSIHVLAQSAGACHASAALFDPRFQPACLPSIRSAILMSGFYRMEAAQTAPNLRAYFGEDISQYEDRSPLSAASKGRTPIGLTVAEFDPLFLARQTVALLATLTERDGQCPPILWNEGHNHVSPVLAIGTGDGDLSGELARRLLRLAAGA